MTDHNRTASATAATLTTMLDGLLTPPAHPRPPQATPVAAAPPTAGTVLDDMGALLRRSQRRPRRPCRSAGEPHPLSTPTRTLSSSGCKGHKTRSTDRTGN